MLYSTTGFTHIHTCVYLLVHVLSGMRIQKRIYHSLCASRSLFLSILKVYKGTIIYRILAPVKSFAIIIYSAAHISTKQRTPHCMCLKLRLFFAAIGNHSNIIRYTNMRVQSFSCSNEIDALFH